MLRSARSARLEAWAAGPVLQRVSSTTTGFYSPAHAPCEARARCACRASPRRIAPAELARQLQRVLAHHGAVARRDRGREARIGPGDAERRDHLARVVAYRTCEGEGAGVEIAAALVHAGL